MSGNKNNTIERVHILAWEDPEIGARDAGSISGIDYLRAIKMFRSNGCKQKIICSGRGYMPGFSIT